MSPATTISILLLSVALLQATEAIKLDRSTIEPVISSGDRGICPSREERQITIERIQNDIKGRIPVTNSDCGEGVWYRVAYFDMKDAAQKCPSTWREYTSSSVRVCGRPSSTSGSCTGISYSTTGRQYSRVCGRAVGYQVASPDGFFSNTIDQAYVDGVSVTYGNPRNHIWTFGVGVTENSVIHRPNNCPCWDSSAKQPPSFVGNNYFCESGNPASNFISGFLYSSDKLWDGEQCSGEGTCCTGPPWFSVQLPSNSTDDIEVRICGNEGTNNEDTPIELMEIYIQ